MLLAIDTSTAFTGLACRTADGLVAECVWRSGRDHTAQLVPQLELLLRQIGAGPEALTAVAVALGPGSWSGLRVGVSTAKGLALARRLPIIGVGTLDALIAQYARPDATVCALIRLGRERFGTQRTGESAPRNLTLAEIGAETHGPTLFCGELEPAERSELAEQVGELARFPAPADALRRPGYLAELGWQRLRAGQTDDLAALEPIYLGNPVTPRAAQ